ncbi:MAG: hypothetical protein WB716_12815 [Candidatus Acidiferrales bacterium]
MKDPEPAVRLRFVDERVQIYVDDVLRLDAPYQYSPVKPTLETDAQLKRWADCLIKDDSDASREMVLAGSELITDGFKQGVDNVWRR